MRRWTMAVLITTASRAPNQTSEGVWGGETEFVSWPYLYLRSSRTAQPRMPCGSPAVHPRLASRVREVLQSSRGFGAERH